MRGYDTMYTQFVYNGVITNVLYGKYAGTEITIEGNDYLIMRECGGFAITKLPYKLGVLCSYF